MRSRNAADAPASTPVAGGVPSTTNPSSVCGQQVAPPAEAPGQPVQPVSAFSASASVSGVTSMGER